MVWRNTSILLLFFTVGYSALPTFHDGVQQGHIASHHIYDPSGLAASHLHHGIYYTYNNPQDGDDGNTLYAVDPKTGQRRATLTIREPHNRQWESIAVGPCGVGHSGSCIYIYMGYSNGFYLHSKVLKFPEPAHVQDQTLQVVDYLYLAWAHLECECIMVDPHGNVYVVSRDAEVGKVPFPKWRISQFVTITETQHLHFRAPRGCDISADGKEMLIKGTDHIHYFTVDNGDVLDAVKRHSEHLPHHEPDGYAIAWTLSGDGFYTLARYHHAPFYFHQRGSTTTPAHTHPKPNPTTRRTTTTNPPTTMTTTSTTTTTTPTATTTTTTSTTTGVPQTNPPNSPLFNNGQMAGSIKSMDLESVSGLVASHLYRGIYYVHNDRGGTNKIYAVNPTTGDLKATYTITGATNTDWEDIAVGPCPSGGSCIYIADTGAGGGTASNIIYMVKEPMEIKDGALPLMDQLHFKWNEQESECLMVDPTGNVYLISEAIGGGKLAKIPMSAWNSATRL